jgi:apolipoprotein N-acyltransferase
VALVVNYRRVLEAIAAMVASAVMFYFGNGLNPWWPLMWLAPVPVLLFALRTSWWAAAAIAIGAMLLGCLNMWSYFTKTLGMPGSLWAGLFLTASAIFAAGVLLFRLLVLRGRIWSGLIALPAVWVTSEYMRNFTTPHGSAGSLAYSQLGFLPFLQLASITGPWGMTFVLLLFPCAIAIALYLRPLTRRRARQVVSLAAAVVGAVLIFGAVRLAMPEKQTVKVGLIASDEKANANVTDPGADTERLFRDYAREARRLAAEGAQAIVMPEKLGVTLEGKAAGTDAVLQSIADETGATVVAGVVHVDGGAKYNEARIYVPRSVVERYDKRHMLPPFESNLTPGTTLALLERAQSKWGVAICKDMDFASPARLYGKAGSGLMLVPAWDFVVDRSWHGHIAAMRGVEDGFSIARAAKQGFLTVSDNRGRIVREAMSSSAPFATLLADVPAAHSWTVYQLLGDWFAWVTIGLLMFVGVRALSKVKDNPAMRRVVRTGIPASHMHAIVIALLVCGCMAATAGENPKLKGAMVKPFLPASAANPRNTEGAFVTLRDGRILFAYSKFSGGGDDGDTATIAGRYSSDGGETWLNEDITLVANEGAMNVMSASLLRLLDGRIGLFYLKKNSVSDCHPYLRYSSDEAKSWSAPVTCIREDGYYVLNNDRVVQLRSGRLVMPVALHPTVNGKLGSKGIAMAYLSDDSGKTWRRSRTTLQDAREDRAGFQEPGVVELRNGQLLMFIRTTLGSQYFSHSNDGGNAWGEARPSNLASPLSPASIKRIPSTGDLLAVWNDHSGVPEDFKATLTNGGKRTPLTVAISKDDGKTWMNARSLLNDPGGWYCYTAIHFVGRDVLLAFASSGTGERRLSKMDLARFPVAELY